MDEYIERKKLLKDLSEIPAYFDSGDIRYGIEIATAKVKEQPTADVVEITRCKDCGCSKEIDGVLYCTYFNKNVDSNDFCSNGG